MTDRGNGDVTISKSALVAIISACLAAGSGGAFFIVPRPTPAAQSTERYEEQRGVEAFRAQRDRDLAVTDAILNGRVTAVEQRFEKVEHALERIEVKVDRVLNK